VRSRLHAYRNEVRCPDAPHVAVSPFYVTVCLPWFRIMWRRWKGL
jgi:hypothetical protein